MRRKTEGALGRDGVEIFSASRRGRPVLGSLAVGSGGTAVPAEYLTTNF